MPQDPVTPEQISCPITIGTLNGNFTASPPSRLGDGVGGTITVNAGKAKRLIFTTSDFQAGGVEYTVQASSSDDDGTTWVSWSPASSALSSAPTVRPDAARHEIRGHVRFVITNSSNNEVETITPATTIVFEDDLGGLVVPVPEGPPDATEPAPAGPPSIVSHVSVAAEDLEASLAFYDAVMPTLGASRRVERSDAVAYGREWSELWVYSPADGDSATPGSGTYFTLRAGSRAQVDAFVAAAAASGGTTDGGAKLRIEHGEACYGSVVRDLDGHEILVMCWDETLS